MALLTCSGLICSDVGKTSGYEGRSKTRSSASSCCWVKASALRCFRKLSTLPWESLFGPEPSEPSTRRKSDIRDTDPGRWPLLYIRLVFSVHLPPPPPLFVRGSEEDRRDAAQVFLIHWLQHTPQYQPLSFECTCIHWWIARLTSCCKPAWRLPQSSAVSKAPFPFHHSFSEYVVPFGNRGGGQEAE